jgi:hypothetical protein
MKKIFSSDSLFDVQLNFAVRLETSDTKKTILNEGLCELSDEC